MDNPDGDKHKRPKKTLAERREAAKIARAITRQRMEAEALEREREEERVKEQETREAKCAKEAENRIAQEQYDHKIAMTMSTTVTLEENPLLMPREEADEKGMDEEHHKISHILTCCCGGFFEGTKNLKLHARENPICLDFWGGSLENVAKEVKKEFKRRKSMRSYYENQGLVLVQRRETYWNNPQKERDRKRVAYNADKEKARERKRSKNDDEAEKERIRFQERYNNDPEAEKLRQAVVRATRAETQTTMAIYSTFEKEGRYGPIFPCVSCQQLNWYTAVSIEDLDTLPVDLVDIQHVRENISLFQKQNRFFLCRPCKKDLEEGICPKMSTKNYLQCPWLDVPPHLLSLNLVRFSVSCFVLWLFQFLRLRTLWWPVLFCL